MVRRQPCIRMQHLATCSTRRFFELSRLFKGITSGNPLLCPFSLTFLVSQPLSRSKVLISRHDSHEAVAAPTLVQVSTIRHAFPYFRADLACLCSIQDIDQAWHLPYYSLHNPIHIVCGLVEGLTADIFVRRAVVW